MAGFRVATGYDAAGDPPAVAIVATSDDYGRTWTPAALALVATLLAAVWSSPRFDSHADRAVRFPG